jgi:hypothetical protein
LAEKAKSLIRGQIVEFHTAIIVEPKCRTNATNNKCW